HRRGRQRGKDLVRAGQIELLHSWKDKNSDVNGHVSLRVDIRRLCHHAVADMPKTPRFTPRPARRVEILAFPGVQLLDVAGPLQVFASARDLVVAAGRPAPYEAVVVAENPLVVS